MRKSSRIVPLAWLLLAPPGLAADAPETWAELDCRGRWNHWAGNDLAPASTGPCTIAFLSPANLSCYDATDCMSDLSEEHAWQVEMEVASSMRPADAGRNLLDHLWLLREAAIGADQYEWLLQLGGPSPEDVSGMMVHRAPAAGACVPILRLHDVVVPRLDNIATALARLPGLRPAEPTGAVEVPLCGALRVGIHAGQSVADATGLVTIRTQAILPLQLRVSSSQVSFEARVDLELETSIRVRLLDHPSQDMVRLEVQLATVGAQLSIEGNILHSYFAPMIKFPFLQAETWTVDWSSSGDMMRVHATSTPRNELADARKNTDPGTATSRGGAPCPDVLVVCGVANAAGGATLVVGATRMVMRDPAGRRDDGYSWGLQNPCTGQVPGAHPILREAGVCQPFVDVEGDSEPLQPLEKWHQTATNGLEVTALEPVIVDHAASWWSEHLPASPVPPISAPSTQELECLVWTQLGLPPPECRESDGW